ncbi:MAG: cytochrome c [Acidobacteria bacterium]|nr:cytochrome c [Acidobacteriota bacterium]
MAVAMLFLVSLLLAQAPNPAAAVAGRRVYEAKKCATCHMVAGEGNIRFSLDHVASRLSEAEIRRWLTDTAEMERGLPVQPAVRMSEWLESNRKIRDHDRGALVAYLSALK